jgi:type IV fimbrial biogenesis protein FimT
MKTVRPVRASFGGSGGFTLVELVIGVTILAIVLAVAVPSFGQVIRVNRLASQVNEYTASLNFARSEAYKRGIPVVVCVANAALSACSTSASWSNGWLSFVDANSNNVVNGGEVILQKVAAPPGGFTYTPTPSTQRTIMFRPLSVAPTNFTLEIYQSGCTGPQKRRITVVSTGRIKMEKVAC